MTYQVMVLQELFPKAVIRPWLVMPDKSKTTKIDRIHSFFRLHRIQQPGRKFTSVEVEFTGDADLLRKNHFLTQVSVEAEVKLLLSDVQTATEKYLASLQPKLRKISTQISVGCRGCEYDSRQTMTRGTVLMNAGANWPRLRPTCLTFTMSAALVAGAGRWSTT